MDVACWTALHGCNVSPTNAFGYFGQNQSNLPKAYPETG
jgi:hypothetical protein